MERQLTDPRGFTCRWCLHRVDWHRWTWDTGETGIWWSHVDTSNVWCLFGRRGTSEARVIIRRARPHARRLRRNGQWLEGPSTEPAEWSGKCSSL